MSDCCSKNSKKKISKINADNLEGFICYCFRKTKKELFDAVKKRNEKMIIAEIKSKMKEPGCFCEKANPSGKCCLADIDAFIKSVKK